MSKIKYKAVVCGGRYDNPWDTEVEVEAESFQEAVAIVYSGKPFDSDIVSMEQVD